MAVIDGGAELQSVADGMFTLPEWIMQPCQLKNAQDCIQICCERRGAGRPQES